MRELRWGILGPGRIARSFALALAGTEGHSLVAVGSRSWWRARRAARELGASRHWGSYRKLVRDPGVDVVYVATPHVGHASHARMALEEGKAVLCEKPLCVTEAQARDLVKTARSTGTFLMEAMWTRCLPTIRQVVAWLDADLIGQPRRLACDFGFDVPRDARSRLYDPKLAGGSLLDLGIYPLSMAALVFGVEPSEIAATAELGPTGVDEVCEVELAYPGGGRASLLSSLRTTTSHRAVIEGSAGRIVVPDFWQATSATLETRSGATEVVRRPFVINGYEAEIAEVGRCVRAGVGESPWLPLDESVALLGIVDRIRERVSLRYPFEG